MSGSRPGPALKLSDFAAAAAARLDAGAWAYLAGGAADELTLLRNTQAWQGLSLAPRVLRPLAGGHTRLSLLGQALAHPILLAPVAHQRLFHPDAERATALAAAVQGAGLVLSAQDSTLLEDVAAQVLAEPARGPLWFQLSWQADRGWLRALLQRVEAAGFQALVLTVDAPTQGARDRERRAGFHLPQGVSAVNLAGAPQPLAPPAGGSALFDGLLQQAAHWDDVAWLLQATRLPVLLKGLLLPDDALYAAALGVAGLIVSNHGGRTLDTTPAGDAGPGGGRCAGRGPGDPPVARRARNRDGPDRLPHAGRHRAGRAVAGLSGERRAGRPAQALRG